MDGDTEFPTICGVDPTILMLMVTMSLQCRMLDYRKSFVLPDGVYQSQQRFGMYRWHIMDSIRFDQDLRVTIQALSWRNGGRYLPLQDDISSVVYWYQTLPCASFPELPDRDQLEII